MKKLVIVALAAAVSFGAFAQESGKDKLDRLEESVISGDVLKISSENEVVSVKFLDHIGWGANIASSNDFKPWNGKSGNWFFNIVGLQIAPASWFDFNIGIDFGGQYFASRDNVFSRNDAGKLVIAPFATVAPGLELTKSRSSFRNLYFSAPVLLEFKADKFTFAAGAEAALNFAGSTRYEYDAGYRYQEGGTKGLEVNLFSWNVMAVVSYSKLGVFFKWRPASVQVFQGTPQFTWWTIGGVLGF